MAWGFAQEAQAGSASAGGTFGVAFTTQGITLGNRILVAVSCWNSTAPQITSITDGAGNTYNGPVKRLTLSDGTDISLWDAVITAGGGTKPTVTAHITMTSFNEIELIVVEYSGLSTATTGYLDGIAGTTSTNPPSPFSSGATSPVAGASNELAVGYYGDGGNGWTVGYGSGWTGRGKADGSTTIATGAFEDQNSTSGSGSSASVTLSGASAPAGILAAIYKLAAAASYERLPSGIYVRQAVNRAGSF